VAVYAPVRRYVRFSVWRRVDALACECPPVPAGGRYLLLHFSRKGIRPALRVIGTQRCADSALGWDGSG